MLNEHDLKDFPKADNSNGWVVQQLVKGIGWQDVEGPYVLKATAETVKKHLVSRDMNKNEFRVYEDLT